MIEYNQDNQIRIEDHIYRWDLDHWKLSLV